MFVLVSLVAQWGLFSDMIASVSVRRQLVRAIVHEDMYLLAWEERETHLM